MDGPKLTGREAAFIEAAMHELAAGASTGQAPGRGPPPASRSPVESPAPSPATTGDLTPTTRTPATRTPATMMPQPSTPPPRADATARIAALMQTEQEENFQRKKRLRQFGVVIPALVLIAATLWVVIAIFRYAKI